MKLKRLLEFFVIGLVFGIIEDLLAIALTTDAKLEWSTVLVVFFIALPFAVISELVVDHPKFWQKILPRLNPNGVTNHK